MSALVIPVQFANLVSATPQQLDQNFTAIAAIMNGKIDATNLSFSPATLDGSSLLQQNAPAGFKIGESQVYYNLGSFQSTASTCAIGNVNVGDLILFSAWISFTWTSNAMAQLIMQKNAGDTCVLAPSAIYSPSQYIVAAATVAMTGQAVVTTAGTLTLLLGYGISGGTLTAGALEIDATVLRLA